MRRCPGCGLALPGEDDGSGRRHVDASPGCLAVLQEVAEFEAQHAALLADHQLLVDAYGAQHPAGPRTIRLAYSLVGLHLALDRGRSGLDVRLVHGGMGRPRPDWPAFDRPGPLGTRTILDVAVAGARADSVAGHAAALRDWAADVWAAWSHQHGAVQDLTARFTH